MGRERPFSATGAVDCVTAYKSRRYRAGRGWSRFSEFLVFGVTGTPIPNDWLHWRYGR
jgi:hypothetical protein